MVLYKLVRGGIIDPDTTSYLLFCVMVSCFAGYVSNDAWNAPQGWEGRNRRHLAGGLETPRHRYTVYHFRDGTRVPDGTIWYTSTIGTVNQ